MTVTVDGAATRTALEDKLADPAVAASLLSLLTHADLVAVLLEGLDQLVGRSETIGGSLMEGLVDLRATVDANETLGRTGVDMASLLDSLLTLASVLPTAAPGMAAAVESGTIDKVFASDLVSPEAVDTVSLLARGMVRGGRQFAADPIRVEGPFSLLRLLKDPDVARALSFGATVAKAVGQELAAAPPAAPA